MKEDFNFVLNLADEFFAQKEVQKKFQLINEHDITGWEIWFQIEFTNFLNKHRDVSEIIREQGYTIDKRTSGKQKSMYIDLLFRKRNCAKDRYIAVEIKQNQSASLCIKGMIDDIRKIWKLKQSEDDLRSMWCLGIYPTIDNDKITELIEKYTDNTDVELNGSLIGTRKIPATVFSYTLL